MEDTILKCRGIRKSFPGVLALDDVDFELKRGEVHALCGENGAGKSTLIKILTGLYAKDAGIIEFEGKEFKVKTVQECRKAGISLIPQEIHLAQTLTVAENICMTAFPQRPRGIVDWKAMNEKARELQSRIGYEQGFGPETAVGTLSMGQQQMVEIMKAISTDLKVIAFDEPTASLSDSETEQLFALIRELTRRGISIIYVSHRLAEIFSICDRVTVLKDGRCIGTKAVADTDMDEVVSMMVGREMQYHQKTKCYIEAGAPVLEAEHIAWGDRVRDVSFALHKGEILGMFGIVGAGRTETMRAIFGLAKMNRGTVRINGEPVIIRSPADALAHRIGFATEDRRGEGLSGVSPLTWNITLPFVERIAARLGLLRHGRERATAQELADKLQIKAPSLEVQAETLSGGNQQKAVIAKWLGASSEILILDEPTRGIDVGAKNEIYRLMEALVSEGKSVIMISSELPELLALSDRILVFRDGMVAAELTDVRSLREEDVLRFAVINQEGEKAV